MGTAFQPQVGGHEMLNHLGKPIRVTERTLDGLDLRGYLQRDKQTGLKQITPIGYRVFVEAERATDWWYELGQDLSGANQVVCRCAKCERKVSEIDKTPLPGLNPLADDENSRMVREIMSRRAIK